MTRPLPLILMTRISLLSIAICSATTIGADEIRFSRDVLPILSDRCFHCHGPDESHREAELRLDQREDAIADRGGYAVIFPQDAANSELIARIVSDDQSLVMPPPDSHRKPLSAREIQILKDWIQQGALWGKHWAFEKPVSPKLPEEIDHPIDYFAQRKLASESLSLSPPAAPHTLLRRVAFDLTGLPPSPELQKRYLSNPTAENYEMVVDQLLASPHYGERMAMWWLDAARFSDTDGFQQDATRTNWPWRDWVIQAFNQNLPFDQFTIEQFAGDLLPEATAEQILATSFHRQHMTNGEGGRDPEESRIDYVIDRVNTTGTLWLGLTLGCCQCHTHKFDPITQREYYQLFSFFNSIDEDGRAGNGAKPYLKYQSALTQESLEQAERVVVQRTAKRDETRKGAYPKFESWLKEQQQQLPAHYSGWQTIKHAKLSSVAGTVLTYDQDGNIFTSGPLTRQDDYHISFRFDAPRITGLKLEVFPDTSFTDGKFTRGQDGEFILTDVKLQIRKSGYSLLEDVEIASAIANAEPDTKGRNYGRIIDTLDDDPRNGWTSAGLEKIEPHTAVFALAEPLVLQPDEELVFVMLHRSTEGNANIGKFRLSLTDQSGKSVEKLEPMPLEKLAAARDAGAEISQELRSELLTLFLEDHAEYQQAEQALAAAQRQLNEFKKGATELNVMVLAEKAKPRDSYVLERGVWDARGEQVQPGMPAAILEQTTEQTLSRLDLAQWLVSPENPLTSRVLVNHLWQICFGQGLVRTPDDFGLQGEYPTHPDLLDWLAIEIQAQNWDIKQLLKLIVTSRTYQQSSVVSAKLLDRDPENRLLARAPRYRLPSWMLRDGALAASGLLNPIVGGPPVMPYQPEGVWEEMFMGRFTYQPSQGPLQYRRTVYAFWRRSAAPTFLFDSAQRRTCEVRPLLTNTPLQALTLLNDHTQLEAARFLAGRAISAADDTDEQLSFLFMQILLRHPESTEVEILQREYQRALAHYQKSPVDVVDLTQLLQLEAPLEEPTAEQAALTVVASLILNLDEAVTHE